MNSNTPTPETDYAFEGDLSVGVNPEITTWQQAKEYARKLERERNMLQAKLTALGGLAVSGWDNKTVGEVDSLISAEKQLEYKDLLRSLFVDIPAERDQLRKVCDELYGISKEYFFFGDQSQPTRSISGSTTMLSLH